MEIPAIGILVVASLSVVLGIGMMVSDIKHRIKR